MRKQTTKRRTLGLASIVALLAAPAAAVQGPAADYFSSELVKPDAPLAFPTDRVPGRALVKLRLDDAEADLLLVNLQARTGISLVLVRPSLFGWGLYDVVDVAKPNQRPDEERTLALIEALRDEPEIADISDERWYQRLAEPSDPGFDDMWHLDSIGATTAWDTTTGLSTQRIGVVDTGTLRNHEELSARDVDGYDFISNGNQAGDGNGRDGDYTDAGDGADCGQGFRPSSWHGSHVAGTILAEPNNGSGVAGINWQAGLVTVRALGRCGGSLTDIMEGAAWLAGGQINGVPQLAAADRVSVMNLSLGGPGGCSGYEQDIIDFISGQGVVFVAAAGNDAGPVGSPANCTGVISVAAHGPTDALSSYSSFGTSIEVVAPGGDIFNNQNQGVLSVSGPGNDDYAWQQGTSMASPHVAGAISLLQTFDPTLDRAALAQLFIDTGGTCSGCQGVPTLRLAAALDAVSGGGPAPEPDPTPEPEPEPEPTPDPVADDDAYEPNDDWASAPTLSCGASLDLQLLAGNVDWFKLDVAADTMLDVSIDAGDVDLDLYLTDGPANDDVIGSSTTPTGVEQIVMPAPGGVIGVVIIPWEDATGPYSLGIACTDPEPEEPEEPTDPIDDPQEPTDPIDDPQEPTDPEDPEDPTVPGGGDDDVPGDDDNPPKDPIDDPDDSVDEEPTGPTEPTGPGQDPIGDPDEGSPEATVEGIEGGASMGCSQSSSSGVSVFGGLLGLLAIVRRRRRS